MDEEIDTRSEGTHSHDWGKAMRVRSTIAVGLDQVNDQHIRECHHLCRQLWLSIACDYKDTWRYYPSSMINEAQQVWEERLDLFEAEMKKRGLKALY